MISVPAFLRPCGMQNSTFLMYLQTMSYMISLRKEKIMANVILSNPAEAMSSVMKTKSGTKVLSLEAYFGQEKADTEKSKPMKVFDHFSRFKISVVNNKDYAYANLPLSDVGPVYERTMELIRRSLDAGQGSDVPDRPAFKVKLTGRLAGKTPAELLAAGQKEALNEQYKWLAANAEKYPRNREQMAAIKDAAALTEEELAAVKGAGGASGSGALLDIGCRPLVRNKRSDGKCFCYEMKVSYDLGKSYPIEVMTVNYYAPVIVRENGAFNVKLSEKDTASEKRCVVSLSLEEWANYAEYMKMSKEAFFNANFMSSLKLASDAAYAARKAYAESKGEAAGSTDADGFTEADSKNTPPEILPFGEQ